MVCICKFSPILLLTALLSGQPKGLPSLPKNPNLAILFHAGESTLHPQCLSMYINTSLKPVAVKRNHVKTKKSADPREPQGKYA